MSPKANTIQCRYCRTCPDWVSWQTQPRPPDLWTHQGGHVTFHELCIIVIILIQRNAALSFIDTWSSNNLKFFSFIVFKESINSSANSNYPKVFVYKQLHLFQFWNISLECLNQTLPCPCRPILEAEQWLFSSIWSVLLPLFSQSLELSLRGTKAPVVREMGRHMP